MSWKTRKQRGGSLASLFKKKKTPLSSQANTSGNSTVEKNTSVVSFKRKQNLANFITLKQKKAALAKMIRAHIQRIKNLNNSTRKQALELMNGDMRNKTRTLLNHPTYNSLSNDQLIEIYQTGKVRSTSH